MNFLSRKFSSHTVEFLGNTYAQSWVHVPVWNIYSAEKGYPITLKSFKETVEKFPDQAFYIGEFCSMSCQNTMLIITKLAKEFRACSNQELIVYPTLLPSAN